MYDVASLPVRVVSTVLQVLGLICTAWRIHFRLKIDRFWWEDAWAAVALFSCLASLGGEWIYSLTHGLVSNVGFWFYTLGFTSIVRATHLSILYSIIRIVPETRLRRFTYFCALCCGIFWTIIVLGKIWQCASTPRWHHYRPPVCQVLPQILIFEFASDCLTVGILIALPLRVLWGSKLPRHKRRMILSIFASSVVLAFAAIFHIVGHVLNFSILMIVGINLEIVSSIIMCNLLVVVTCAYRFWWRRDRRADTTTVSETEPESDDFTQPRTQFTRSPLTLTTINVSASMLVTQHNSNQASAQSCSVLTDDVS